MKCFTPIVSFDVSMGNYFTSFRLLIHIGVNNIRETGVLNKNRLANALSFGDSCKRKERGHFEQQILSKKPV